MRWDRVKPNPEPATHSLGEDALLRGEPLPVTAVAAGTAVLLCVPRDAFLRAMAPHVAARRAAAAAFLTRHVAAFQGQRAQVGALPAGQACYHAWKQQCGLRVRCRSDSGADAAAPVVSCGQGFWLQISVQNVWA